MDNNENVKNKDLDYKKYLEQEKNNFESVLRGCKTKNRQSLRHTGGILFLGLVLIVIAISTHNNFQVSNVLLTLGCLTLITGIYVLALAVSAARSMELGYKEKLISINEELELINYYDVDDEKRAEQRFKQHQEQLKRYYDVNIKQLKAVFPLGIFAMIFGTLIVGMTIYLFKDNPNVIPTVAGCVSGLLIDFIGAVFIQMYTKTVKASTKFHDKLIGSNNNLFANVLVTKISDPKVKDEAFAEIAKIITRASFNSEPKTADKSGK